ncbi:hypothetical protein [Mucilaginibacter defluvii]|uniref:hypothetical protein n=1 Tax=Mucilaginibacter defluvii TaxID=1196019 RepID=UPI0031E80CAD
MPLEKRDYDAVAVGSGPNRLAAAILLQQQGLQVISRTMAGVTKFKKQFLK